MIKLQLPTSMRLHPVVNVSQVVWCREQVGGQRVEKVKLVKINGVEKWKVEKNSE